MPYPELTGDDDHFLKSTINTDVCVLFLGPLFGLNIDNAKIYRELVDGFAQDGPKVDTDFENLFIRTNDYHDMKMVRSIKDRYSRVMPSPVYDKIAQINFTTIVTFTQDVFLRNVFRSNNIEHNFKSYSLKGNSASDTIIDTAKSFPYIYNVYGSIDDSNSVITNYAQFYDFLFSILGDNKLFPTELIQRISEAESFIFLGFDLKKWYVPLFITKIFNMGRHGNRPNHQVPFASLTDTDTSNEQYLQWLERYPLRITLIKDTYGFLDYLLLDNATRRKQPLPSFEVTKEKWLQELSAALVMGARPEIYTSIIEYANKSNKRQLSDKFFLLKSNLLELIVKSHSGTITDQDFAVQTTRNLEDAIYFLKLN